MNVVLHFLRDYSFPTLLALLLHATLVTGLLHGYRVTMDQQNVVEPNAMMASLVFHPEKRSAPVTPTLPTPSDSAPKTEAETDPVEEKPKVDMEQVRREQQLAEERLRLERLRQLAYQSALESEGSKLQAADEDETTMRYVDGIYTQIVSAWSRPLSARRSMSATILVELFPDGNLNSVGLIESSGNEAFDRSALAAVHRAGRFTVPEDSDLFEERFRRLTLVFKPLDLIR